MSQLAPNLEMRLIRLEENAYFQEERIKALDEQLLTQQQSMDELAAQLKVLRQRVRDMEDNAEARTASQGNELPPHYLEKLS